MSTSLKIELLDGRTAFAPGETIEGVVSWQLKEPPKELELHLLYHTRGKGDDDAEVAETAVFPGAGASGVETFRFTAPSGPYSFSGRLISLSWTLELTTGRRKEIAQQDITLSPTGDEIRLGAVGKVGRK
jgi:hypothetical protein